MFFYSSLPKTIATAQKQVKKSSVFIFAIHASLCAPFSLNFYHYGPALKYESYGQLRLFCIILFQFVHVFLCCVLFGVIFAFALFIWIFLQQNLIQTLEWALSVIPVGPSHTFSARWKPTQELHTCTHTLYCGTQPHIFRTLKAHNSWT